jgi:hypothetical protein
MLRTGISINEDPSLNLFKVGGTLLADICHSLTLVRATTAG